MPKKPSLENLADIGPVKSETPARKSAPAAKRAPKPKPKPKWEDRTVRRWVYLDRDVLAAAEAKLAANPDSEHRYLSGQISELVANWVAGHYDDVHQASNLD